MIVDCHTHAWAGEGQLGPAAADFLRAARGIDNFSASAVDHGLVCQCVGRALVLALSTGQDAPAVLNDYVAQYVSREPRAIGIAGVDPTDSAAARQAAEHLDRREFRGLVVSPLCQDFHPSDSRAMAVYELAQDRGVPVFFDNATHLTAAGRLEFARPSLLDDVAREFPQLRIVIAAMGYPWIDECITLMAKHPRVCADVASLLRRPWQAYNCLLLAHQFGVADKLLFGSDFPYFTPAEAIEAIYRLGEMTHGTSLLTVPREVLRGIVERDALTALGISRPGEAAAPEPDTDDEEE